nr:hypothetical protein [Marseillevirus cajuinensis]
MEYFFDDGTLASACINDEELLPILEERNKKTLLIHDRYTWQKIGEENAGHPNILLDAVYSNLKTIQRFPDCKRLFARKCEKNFFYHQVGSRNFPNLEELWIHSHPCESKVFYEKFPKIFITQEYANYVKRWAPKGCDCTIITPQEFEAAIAAFERKVSP